MRRVSIASCLALLLVATVPVLAGVAQSQTIRVEQDIKYGTAAGEALYLDAYVPPGEGLRPAAIMIHGGRWMSGDKSDVPARTVAEYDFVTFSVNYRLARRSPYPAAVEDVQTAVRWVRDHASEFGVDPERVWAFGGSAGGHLAAMLATIGKGPLDTGSRVAAAVSWSGPMDLVTPVQTEDALSRIVPLFLGCSSGNGCLQTAKEASPVTHVDPTDAPMFIASATHDPVPLDQAQTMADALADKNVPYELFEVPGKSHSWRYGREALGPTLEFIEKWIDVDLEIGPQPPIEVPEGEGRPEARESLEGRPGERPVGRTEARETDTGIPAGVIAGLIAGMALLALALGLVMGRLLWRPRAPDPQR